MDFFKVLSKEDYVYYANKHCEVLVNSTETLYYDIDKDKTFKLHTCETGDIELPLIGQGMKKISVTNGWNDTFKIYSQQDLIKVDNDDIGNELLIGLVSVFNKKYAKLKLRDAYLLSCTELIDIKISKHNSTVLVKSGIEFIQYTSDSIGNDISYPLIASKNLIDHITDIKFTECDITFDIKCKDNTYTYKIKSGIITPVFPYAELDNDEYTPPVFRINNIGALNIIKDIEC